MTLTLHLELVGPSPSILLNTRVVYVDPEQEIPGEGLDVLPMPRHDVQSHDGLQVRKLLKALAFVQKVFKP